MEKIDTRDLKNYIDFCYKLEHNDKELLEIWDKRLVPGMLVAVRNNENINYLSPWQICIFDHFEDIGEMHYYVCRRIRYREYDYQEKYNLCLPLEALEPEAFKLIGGEND